MSGSQTNPKSIPANQALGQLFDEKLNLTITTVGTRGRYADFRGNVSYPTNHPNSRAVKELAALIGTKIVYYNNGASLRMQFASAALIQVLDEALPFMTKKKDYVERFLEIRKMYKRKELGKIPDPYIDLWYTFIGKGEPGKKAALRANLASNNVSPVDPEYDGTEGSHITDEDYKRIAKQREEGNPPERIMSHSEFDLIGDDEVVQTAEDVFGSLLDEPDNIEAQLQEDEFYRIHGRDATSVEEFNGWVAKYYKK